jgi:predicted nucleic acid-binding Zn ribbon protein
VCAAPYEEEEVKETCSDECREKEEVRERERNEERS